MNPITFLNSCCTFFYSFFFFLTIFFSFLHQSEWLPYSLFWWAQGQERKWNETPITNLTQYLSLYISSTNGNGVKSTTFWDENHQPNSPQVFYINTSWLIISELAIQNFGKFEFPLEGLRLQSPYPMPTCFGTRHWRDLYWFEGFGSVQLQQVFPLAMSRKSYRRSNRLSCSQLFHEEGCWCILTPIVSHQYQSFLPLEWEDGWQTWHHPECYHPWAVLQRTRRAFPQHRPCRAKESPRRHLYNESVHMIVLQWHLCSG